MVTEYELKNGEKRYQYRVYLGIDPKTGEEIAPKKQGFLTRREATNAEARIIADYEAGKKVHKVNKVKFKEAADLWFDHYKLSVSSSTAHSQKANLNNHILPAFGRIYIDQISLEDCQKFANEIVRKLSHYPNILGITSQIFKFAINLDYIDTNPMQNIIRPKKKRGRNNKKSKEIIFFDKNELNHFFEVAFANMDFKFCITYWLLAYTGIRRSELVTLRWSDLDEVNKTLTIDRGLTKDEDGHYMVGGVKTEAGYRTIGIDDQTIEYLNRWRREQKEELIKLGFNANRKNQYILTNDNNRWMNPVNINKRLTNFTKKYGFPNITPHGFRHSHCTLLFESGASIKEVQYRMGHDDVQTTMQTYNHVTAAAKKQTAVNFSRFMTVE